MSENNDHSKLLNQNVTDFVTLVSEYCIFVENTIRFSKKDFLAKASKMLPMIYLKVSLLPKFDSLFDDENEKFVTEEDWDFIHSAIKNKLTYHDEYRDVFDPLTHEQLEQSTSSISDNLADMYQDLKNFISLYNVGKEEVMNDALWECQMNFEEFWGIRLLSALKAIHTVLYSGDDLEDDEPEQKNDEELDTTNWFLSKRQEDFREEE
ncbi:MAG: DUF5063 domain-containing protein [Bacteroidota bacterium]|nr:DUF5063 domain-containing protein [Bacteroidota bacterium]